jgi:hypothetical protein
MKSSWIFASALAATLAITGSAVRATQDGPNRDFGLFIAEQLRTHSEQLFGFSHPLRESSAGPYDGVDNTKAIDVAQGLNVSLVSSSVASATDRPNRHVAGRRSAAISVCLRRGNVKSGGSAG